MLAQLYGGAITTTLPDAVVDVSKFRQVPDTQEVFIIEGAEQKLDQLIIIDLCEAVEGEKTEKESAHVEELVEAGESLLKLHSLGDLNNTFLDSTGSIYAVETSKKDFVLLVCVFSVTKVETDIVLSMNVPAVGVNGDTFNTLVADIQHTSSVPYVKTIGDAYSIFRTVCADLKVRDWGLFQ